MNLQFQTIKIKNFKAFVGEHNFQLDRGPGLFYVTGENLLNPAMGANGVGKTTLWDALTWVLWGRTGRDNKPASAIVPWGMDKGTTEVTLKFMKGGRQFTLKRSRSPNSLELINGKMPDKVREIPQTYVAEVLGLSEAAFRRAIVLGQFGRLFLDLRAEEQSQLFTEACNLNVWLDASKKARDHAQGTVLKIVVCKDDIRKLEGRILELSDRIKSEEAASSGFERKKKEAITSLEQNIDAKQQFLAKLLKEHDLTAPRRAEERVSMLKAIESLLKKASGSYELLRDDMAHNINERSALSSNMKHFEDTLVKYAEEAESGGTCPTCGQEVSKKHLLVKMEEYDTKIFSLNNKIKELVSEYENLEIKYNKQLQLMGTYRGFILEATNQTAAINAAEESLASLKKETNPHERTINLTRETRKARKEEKKELEEELAKWEHLKGVAEYWEKAFKEIRLSILDSITTELEMTVMSHAESLGLEDWRIEFRTDRVTAAGNVSVAFTVFLYPPDLEEPIKWESYSGGESQRWQLAVAFGLSEVLLERAGVSTNMEVIDEPTKGLSPEGVSTLLQSLSERAKATGRSIYFVDHHLLESGKFDGIIRVINDEKGAHVNAN